MISSKFNLISIGIVVEDKSLYSDLIKVYPIEILPLFSGELEPNDVDIESAGKDDSGNLYSVKIEVSNYIEATWLNDSSNRITSPNVVKGEQVLIYSYADVDTYYWASMGRDKRLRKLETVSYGISDLPENTGDIDKTRENQYLLEMSTHGKHLTVKTCKSNNEPFAYVIQLNTNDGCFFIKDDTGNVIYLDSKNTEIRLENKNNTIVSLDKTNLNIQASNDINILANNNINITAGNDISIDADNNLTVNVGGNISYSSGSAMNYSAGDSYNLDAGSNYSVNAKGSVSISSPSTAVIKAPAITLNGSVSMGVSSLNQNAYANTAIVYGDMAINGSISVTNVISSKTISADSISAKSMKADRFDGDFYGTLYGSVVP